MESFHVNAPSRSYPICFYKEDLTRNMSFWAKELLSSPEFEKKVILTDKNIYRLYEKTIRSFVRNIQGDLMVIPAGEKQKNIRRAYKIYTELLERGFHRNSLLIAMGGGVIGDLGGFIASTYLRGIGFIQVPTTLLAQVDSSVGGKVAINHPLSKNSIGTFYQPWEVNIFLPFLKTLSAREYRSGLAEVVKYGVICDSTFFSYLCENSDQINKRSFKELGFVVRRSCEIKAEIVEQDEKETNIRAILNFGHTLGHALEIASRHRIRHGQAVAMGSLFAAYMSVKLGLAKTEVYHSLLRLYSQLKLPVKASSYPEEELLCIMAKDKKNQGDTITFVLPQCIGAVQVRKDLKIHEVRAILKQYYKEHS